MIFLSGAQGTKNRNPESRFHTRIVQERIYARQQRRKRKHDTMVVFIVAKPNGRVRFEGVDIGVEHVTNGCNTTGWRSARKTVGEHCEISLYRISNPTCRPFQAALEFRNFSITVRATNRISPSLYSAPSGTTAIFFARNTKYEKTRVSMKNRKYWESV